MNKTTKRAIAMVFTSLFSISIIGGLTGGFIENIITQHKDDVTDIPEPLVEVATFEENTSEEVSSEEVDSEEITDVVETTTAEAKIENTYYDCPLSHDLQDYIRELCNENGIPMSLVIAIIDVESSFNPDAVSSTNDFGLMQINKSNHEWLRKQGVTDVFDPYQNVRGGIMILSQCYNGNLNKTLMSYNLGEASANELWNNGIYSTSYSRAVLSNKEVYDEQV